jgi:hypothetical protein
LSDCAPAASVRRVIDPGRRGANTATIPLAGREISTAARRNRGSSMFSWSVMDIVAVFRARPRAHVEDIDRNMQVR